MKMVPGFFSIKVDEKLRIKLPSLSNPPRNPAKVLISIINGQVYIIPEHHYEEVIKDKNDFVTLRILKIKTSCYLQFPEDLWDAIKDHICKENTLLIQSERYFYMFHDPKTSLSDIVNKCIKQAS